MASERELKYRPTDERQAERVVSAILEAMGNPERVPVVQEFTTVYFDDASGTLASHGVALRLRSHASDAPGLWGVKALAMAPIDGQWEFAEWEVPGEASGPPTRMRQLLAALGLHGALCEVAVLATVRVVHRVVFDGARGELCVDRVTVRAPREGRFLELEFESESDRLRARARQAVDEMVDAPPSSTLSKLEAALGASRRCADAGAVALVRREGCLGGE